MITISEALGVAVVFIGTASSALLVGCLAYLSMELLFGDKK